MSPCFSRASPTYHLILHCCRPLFPPISSLTLPQKTSLSISFPCSTVIFVTIPISWSSSSFVQGPRLDVSSEKRIRMRLFTCDANITIHNVIAISVAAIRRHAPYALADLLPLLTEICDGSGERLSENGIKRHKRRA